MENLTNKRLLIFQEFIPPYRINFFSKLSGFSNFECLFVHGVKNEEDGRPGSNRELPFPNELIKYYKIQLGPVNFRWEGGAMDIVKKFKPDVIIVPGIPSILTYWYHLGIARVKKCKSIIWYSGWESRKNYKFALQVKKLLLRIYFKLSDHILVYSSSGKDYLVSLGLPAQKITIAYNGLDIGSLVENEMNIIEEGKKLRGYYKAIDKKIFLYVGGMIPEKQVHLLLKAYIDLNRNDSLLWIIGDGPELKKYQNYVEQNKITGVKFFGRIVDEVDKYFTAADFFVLPGVGGLAINQALFWKLPCVVGEADGTEHDLIIEGETGFYFKPNDKKSLIEAMEKCLHLSDVRRQSMGAKGRSLIVGRSNVDKMVDTFINTVDNLLREPL